MHHSLLTPAVRTATGHSGGTIAPLHYAQTVTDFTPFKKTGLRTMARVYTFPRAGRGEKIFRVEWKKDSPSISEFVVQTAATSSVVVHDSGGKEHIFVGKETLRQFGISPEDAVSREFSRIATMVSRHGANPRLAVQQASRLGKLLESH